jgi:hypothetical protein
VNETDAEKVNIICYPFHPRYMTFPARENKDARDEKLEAKIEFLL